MRLLMRGTAALLVLMAVCGGAPAHARLIKPGTVPTLKADEGLLVVGIDSNMPLVRVKVRKDNAVFGGGDMKDLPEGRSLRLYALPAGRYEWSQLRPVRYFTYDLRNEPEFEFVIEPGRINYAGDLQFRARTIRDSRFHIANRSLGVIDWLKKEHPQVYAGYELTYTGHYPDPFPAFYRDVVRSAGNAPVVDAPLAAPPKPATLPLPVRTLWKEDRVLSARINPAGTLVAVHVHSTEKRWDVELVDLMAGTVSTLASSSSAFGGIRWANDRVVLMPISEEGAEEIHAARIQEPVGGKRAIERYKLPRKGFLIDTLPGDENQILFGSIGSYGELLVHRMDISSADAAARFRFHLRDRLNIGVKDDLRWFTDGRGRLRVALAMRDDTRPRTPDGDEEGDDEPPQRLVLMHGADGVFREVMEIEDEEPFSPEGVSSDGSLIYGITEKDRAQKELVAFDPVSKTITRTVFSKPGVDVVTALFDDAHNVIGVGYYQGGLFVSEYFDASASAQGRLLTEAFPGKTVVVGDRSRDGKQMLVWVEAGDQPAQLYHLDGAARRATLLDETMPDLPSSTLAPSKAFTFKGVDGTPLEAFITLPRTPGPHPLVVAPHGGPIGISDKLHFDPEVQFLASLGYAVLRVNFRGSEGYGKAFREKGHRNYGTAIEDDIDAAIGYATANYPLDASRMCAVGTSYGGYSSMIMAIRWPQRFRCAVTIAGVSDRILFFTASDGGRVKRVRETMEKLIGNPHTDLAAMQASSPIYQYRDLKVPVMIVHGTEDVRVDLEHARRLQRMLQIDGRPPVGLVFEKEGHGVEKIDNVETMWTGIAGFLQAHLGASPVPATKAAAP
ncbi:MULTISPECIES: prolyl oligopeptidase family serine peptidase [unclassified Pseudoxanthomonas]|uniref:alpha/beta hydrolase family protein n=1 Tax=unclassified Pseudoxanthomonas TaxID=2645906 RepID=UPI0008EEA458|nr:MULTISPECIES: prolyl oligopeptidase family serine peptidase [unclassified Pseudoxanthomonas]PPJ42529.1 S9 family peptidase [Pseudoxanthomonas sp. KAs_5_3]SFV26983.1 Dipeptidyl aminopeptidase/acylaminoacyl peptidase [Pseudoxanthomonas sp. YR558]